MTFTCRHAGLVGGWLLACAVSPAPVQAAPDGDALRQVAGILDYVGADYAVAVDASGRVVSELEYREQFSLTADALALAGEAGIGGDDPVIRGLEELEQLLESKVAPERVLAHCRRIRKSLVRNHGVVLTPSVPPDAARARELYFAYGCNACHGERGGADTPQAKKLDPPPADFLDPERMAGVSPHRAFHAISHGVKGTGMTGYGYLSEEDRWSLAFWVLSLRHDGKATDLERGERAVAAAERSLPRDAAELASLTDDDLRARLSGHVGAGRDLEAALAFLRAKAPFATSAAPREPLRLARARLEEGLEAYRRGEGQEARRLFVSAYLDGFEPHEPTLRARDADLVQRIESSILRLREHASAGRPVEEVEQQAEEVLALLTDAERGGRLAEGTTFLGAAAIALREGFEAVLLVVALLALVRRRGASAHAKYVHAGWIAAIPAGFLTWLALGQVLGGLERELAEGIVALTAAVVLLGVTHWIVGQATARRWMGFLARRIGDATQGRWAAAAVFALAFVAVYREAFEVVLFYKALLLDAVGQQHLVWLGALSGLVALAVVAFVLRRVGQRLQPRAFMLASGAMLALLSLMLLGKGIRSLQEAGVLAVTELGVPSVPALGVFGTVQGLGAQGVLFVLLALSALGPWLAAGRGGAAATPAE